MDSHNASQEYRRREQSRKRRSQLPLLLQTRKQSSNRAEVLPEDASELGEHGITVNSVAPGFMPTSPDYVKQWDSYGKEQQAAIVKGIAMRRIGNPEDIANAVLFFASDKADWITGQTLAVTGGP